jgi:hypothetical protein
MTQWLAIAAGMSITGIASSAASAVTAQDGVAEAGMAAATSSDGLALSPDLAGIGQAGWLKTMTIDRSLFPAPLQPRLATTEVRRKLDSMGIAMGNLQLSLVGMRGRPGSEL